MVHVNNIFGGFVLLVIWPVVIAGINCALCNDAVSIEECVAQGTVTCGDNENCYFEKITTDSLSVAFNAGCRSIAVCNIMASLSAAPGKRTIVNCAQCCNNTSSTDQPCNAHLCGQRPSAPVLQCQQCPHPVASVADCPHMVTCQPSELCYSDIYMFGGSILRYMRGCREKSLCQNGTAVHNTGRNIARRSDLNLCSECCDGDQCNLTGCYQLQRM